MSEIVKAATYRHKGTGYIGCIECADEYGPQLDCRGIIWQGSWAAFRDQWEEVQ